MQGLHEYAKKKHATSVTHLKPNEATAVVQEVIRDHWGNLVLACLHETLGPCGRTGSQGASPAKADGGFAGHVGLRGRVQQQSVASLRRRIRARRRGEDSCYTGYRGDKPQVNFATPLDMTDDPTSDPAAPLGGKLRQNLIRPILRQVVFSLEEIKDGEGGIGKTEDRLIKTIGRLKRERQEFLADVKREKQESFYRGVSPMIRPPNTPISRR